MQLDDDFLEDILIKTCLLDKDYSILVTRVFLDKYFESQQASKTFTILQKYLAEYNEIPNKELIVNQITDSNDKQQLSNYIDNIYELEFDFVKHYKFLLDETNRLLKNRAIKQAIMDSVNIIESKQDINIIRSIVENALAKDIKIDLGLNYFGSLKERLQRILTAGSVRVPTYYPTFDEYIAGGFPPYTLSIIVAKIHGFKTNTLANIASRQVLHGKNVVIMTMEMSEDAYAQRLDSIYSGLDINRIYTSKDYRKKMVEVLKNIRNSDNIGNLYIKQFPTGEASVNDFRSYLRELKTRGIHCDIILVDYINLMKRSYATKGDLYSDVKGIAEELRALSFEFEAPVVSVSQLNREGSMTDFGSVDFTFISESLGVPATADFMAIYGLDEDAMTYENELLSKIVKNRLGGRVNEVFKYFYDSRSLKMYDETELELWMKEAECSKDDRDMLKKEPTRKESKRKRK